LSGLCCARNLLNNGKKTLLLEARDRFGGRTETTEFQAEPIDIGGQWVGARQLKILKLIEELGLKTFRQYTVGKSILVLKGDKRVEYSGLSKYEEI